MALPAREAEKMAKTGVIPAPGTAPDAKRDAAEAFAVLKAGGVVVVPNDLGYSLLACSAPSISKAYAAKGRQAGHTIGLVGTVELMREVMELTPEQFEVARVLTTDMGFITGFVASCKSPPPGRMAHLDPDTLARVTRGGTVGVAVPESPFLRELGRLNDEAGQFMVGTSANVTGTGQKFRVQDVEDEVLAAADLIVDYGLQKYHGYDRPVTNLDLTNRKVLRMGAFYEVVREKLERWFGWEDLPVQHDSTAALPSAPAG